jgi:hypothetical protein
MKLTKRPELYGMLSEDESFAEILKLFPGGEPDELNQLPPQERGQPAPGNEPHEGPERLRDAGDSAEPDRAGLLLVATT